MISTTRKEETWLWVHLLLLYADGLRNLHIMNQQEIGRKKFRVEKQEECIMSKKIVADSRKTMTKKAFRALQASKRNAWSCARPEGFRLTNRKEYSHPCPP